MAKFKIEHVVCNVYEVEANSMDDAKEKYLILKRQNVLNDYYLVSSTEESLHFEEVDE